MMRIVIDVDVRNPGQFFACCGLFELADRFWNGAEAWFDGGTFVCQALSLEQESMPDPLAQLLSVTAAAPLNALDPEDPTSSPMRLDAPFELSLNWWHDRRSGGRNLKVWAGTMRAFRIASAMQKALAEPHLHNRALLNHGRVVYDVVETRNKVEPFYFDARRGASARSLDIGFSPDALGMTTTCFPAVEFLALVGLQRFRPCAAVSGKPRMFEYSTWARRLQVTAAMAAVCGLLPGVGYSTFRFENAFRTDQRKHKAFTPATHYHQELL